MPDERPKLYLANRLYVPEHLVTRAHRRAFTYLFGPEHSDDPDEFLEVKTYREFSNDLIGFSRGNLQKLLEVFPRKDYRIVDQRSLVPHGYDLEFTGTLTAEQMRCWAEWLAFEYGTIEAPPRWGKSIIAVWMTTRLRQRTLFLAQEDQLLEQLEEEMRKFTNVTELERKHGKRLIGRARNASEVLPIATFSSWQMYDHHLGQLRENRDAWGAVFVDEAHSASAPCFARVVNTTNSHFRVALTATPERKDGLHVVMFDVVGPVVAKGATEQLPVHVKVVKTGIPNPPSGLTGHLFWDQLLRRLMKHERRNELIARRVLRDARQGHSVLVVTDRIQHIKILIGLMRALDSTYCEKYGKKAVTIGELHGKIHGKRRKALRLGAKDGSIQIVVAYSKIVQLGWNVPAWSSLHSVMPMSNAPNWYQRISRIRTKCANCPGIQNPDCQKKGLCLKKPPVCHIYVDNSRVAMGCFATQQGVHKRLGFVEEVEREDISICVERDPNKKPSKLIGWTEFS